MNSSRLSISRTLYQLCVPWGRKKKRNGPGEIHTYELRLCLQSLLSLEIPDRVERGRESDLGSNGFTQQLPFYILLPKSPITEQGLYPNIIFLPSWICRKMTQCWAKWGFLAFPHASESFYSDMLILQVIWSAPGNINNIYSKSCTLSVMCKRPAFPIATWKWEIQMGPFRLSCSETIRQCQLHALASPVLQELESDGGGVASWFRHFLHSNEEQVWGRAWAQWGLESWQSPAALWGNREIVAEGGETRRLWAKNSLSIGNVDCTCCEIVLKCVYSTNFSQTSLSCKVVSSLCMYNACVCHNSQFGTSARPSRQKELWILRMWRGTPQVHPVGTVPRGRGRVCREGFVLCHTTSWAKVENWQRSHL